MNNVLPRELNQARRARVVELTRQGFSATEIAGILSITKRSVTRIRSDAGIAQQIEVVPLTEDERRSAAALLDDGCSISEVARTLGRCDTTIHKHFPGRGWPKGEGGRLACFNRWIREQAEHAGINL
jgi:IS30 family transposase